MRASSFCYLGLLSIIPLSAVLLPVTAATPRQYQDEIPVDVDQTWVEEEIDVDMDNNDTTTTIHVTEE